MESGRAKPAKAKSGSGVVLSSGPDLAGTRWARRIAVLIGIGIVALVLDFLLIPRCRFVVTDFTVPGSIVGGEDLGVTALVANEGRAGGEHELTLLVDGTPTQTVNVGVDAGTEERVVFSVPDLSPGNHTVNLEGRDEPDYWVWVMTPPEFVIDSVFVSPNPMDINTSNEATVSVYVSNLGEADGRYDLSLWLDGEIYAFRSIHLWGGGDTAETFTIRVDEPGSHEVTVDDVTVDLEVYQIERPANGTIIVNKIGGGASRLTIVNNDDRDVVVVLTHYPSFSGLGGSAPAELAVYVRANSSYTVGGIGSGIYDVYYSFGSSWCVHNSMFTEGASYGVFQESADLFSDYWSYTESSVQFGVAGSGSQTEPVAPEYFPSM